MEDLIKHWEDNVQSFSEVVGSREALCMAAGYAPSWVIAEMYSTHGLHPISTLPIISKFGLKMDWGGLELELQYTAGLSKQAAKSLCKEARHFA